MTQRLDLDEGQWAQIRTKDEVTVLERKRVNRVHQQYDIWVGKLEKDGYDPQDAATYQV